MDCFCQAKVHLPLSDARWTLNLAKNKLGQRLRRARRREVGNVGWDGGWVDGFLMFSAFCRMKSSVKKRSLKVGIWPSILGVWQIEELSQMGQVDSSMIAVRNFPEEQINACYWTQHVWTLSPMYSSMHISLLYTDHCIPNTMSHLLSSVGFSYPYFFRHRRAYLNHLVQHHCPWENACHPRIRIWHQGSSWPNKRQPSIRICWASRCWRLSWVDGFFCLAKHLTPSDFLDHFAWC